MFEGLLVLAPDQNFPNPNDHEPVLIFRASRMATRGRGLAAAALPVEHAIFEDRVEERTPGLLGRRKSQSIRFAQVAQVAMKRGLPFCRLTIESTGGHSIVVEGLTRVNADRAKEEVDTRMRLAAGMETGADSLRSTATSEELARLADLKERGLLTEEEFAAAKKSLLGL